MPDPSHVCDLHHSSWQCQILNPLSEARDRSHVLMDTNWFHYCWATRGTPIFFILCQPLFSFSNCVCLWGLCSPSLGCRGPKVVILFFFALLRLYLQHMEVPGLWVKSELQLPAYTTATAMPDPSCICKLHHSLWQCQILNPLSKARDQTCNEY